MTEVLIVGAGPAGLATACGLLQHGIDVRVVDQADGPATTSRANILHARGVEVLSRLGALGDLPDRCVSAIKMTLSVGQKPLTTMRFGQLDGHQLSALFVSQAEVEAQLRRRLDELGGKIEWQTSLRQLDNDEHGVTAVMESGERIQPHWLVGGDGAHSTTRRLAGIAFPGVPLPDQWLLADVHVDWDADRASSAGWFHRDGVVFAMPMREAGRDDLWRLMCDARLADGETLTPQDIVNRIGELFTERSGITGVRIRDAKWTSVFRIHRRLAERYRSGRVLLVGDAAHVHSPFGGQGMNTGIGDAENLAWKLALVVRDIADERLLDTYETERRPLATEVLRGTTRNTRILLGEGWFGRFLRDRILIPIAGMPKVQRRATLAASQLWVSYRRGPLGGNGRGDRVPDLACTRSDGTATTLHAELGGRWALVVPDPSRAPTVAALGPSVVTLVRPGAAMLVRPDAHLAWRGRPDSPDLARWLDKALRSGRTR